jgi:2-polyprenyl-3-methyl-5-hydroxy-6-metoxy-1,4-benzoquinol methylase
MVEKRFETYDKHYERLGNRAASEQVGEYALTKASQHYEGWLPRDKSIKTLDVGCGLGHQLMTLSMLGYGNLTGIELVPDMAERAAADLKGRAEVIRADAFEWLSGHGSEFGLVVCFDVLEHIPREKAIEFVSLIHAALVPGGTAVFRVPNMSAILASFNMHMDFTHVAGYTEHSLMQLFDMAGFEGHKLENARVLVNLKRWRPWAPWRGVREIMNWTLHIVLYLIKGTAPRPKVFERNIMISTRKPSGG